MNSVNLGSMPATTGQVPKTIGRVPTTVDRMSEEIAAEYHTCLTPYRAKPGTSDMFHKWIRHIRWSETLQFIKEVELYIIFILIHIF
jgi:hypothetical protein